MEQQRYISTKLIDGFSTCFRQFGATETHCKFLHGYSVSFKCQFSALELDERNWVFDFGGFKRSKTTIEGMKPNDYFNWLLDHTVLVSEKDPYLDVFKQMDTDGIIQLRILPDVGCELFAKYLFEKISDFIIAETNGRVRLDKIEVFEHAKNSAVYSLN